MGIRKRRAQKHSKTHIVGFGIAGFLGFIALLVIVLAISLGVVVNSWLEDLPDYTAADAYAVSEPTNIYDSDGNLIASYYLENRISVDLSEISQYVIDGTVDTEDKRYYSHNGIDPQGILRAAVNQVLGTSSEGGSTITQQLVRNTVLSDEQFEYSLKRKVREAYIAIQMEKEYSKEEILEMYLNTIYYGNGAYGIEAASIMYFNKSASELTLAEAALLVGIPNSPTAYDPTRNPEASVSRRNTVLSRMLEAGDITQEEYEAAVNEELVLNEGELPSSVGTYPYFTDYVRQLLLEDFDSDTIYSGGLSVYTTIDPEIQAVAEEVVEEQVAAGNNDELDASLVCIDNTNGYIVAMVGGSDYYNESWGQVNLATSGRQAGSTFKVFTLLAAMNMGMSPTVILNCNSPVQATSTWLVSNMDSNQYGYITLAEATAHSSNTGYAQVAVTIGADAIVEMAHAMGIDSELSAYPSITLGTSDVTVLEMAEAYSTIASGGYHRDSVAITRIEDLDGNVIYEHEDNPEQVFSTAIASDAIEVLESVIASGMTGYYINSYWDVDQPVAGKTGTTDSADNLWFCGFTPQYTAAVWCGYPQSYTKIIYNGSTGTTAKTVQPIFTNFFNNILEGVERGEWPSTTEEAEYLSNDSWEFVGTDSSYNSTSYDYDYDYDDSDDNDLTEVEVTTTETTVTDPTTDNTGDGDYPADTGGSDGSGGDTSGDITDTGGDTGGGDTSGGSTDGGSAEGTG